MCHRGQPKFYGQRLDLEVLYKTVKEMGGFEQVSIERKWAQVARIICSDKSTSNGSFMIKRIYERMLLDLEIDMKNQQSNRKLTAQQLPTGHIQKNHGVNEQEKTGQMEYFINGDTQLSAGIQENNCNREVDDDVCGAFVALLQHYGRQQQQHINNQHFLPFCSPGILNFEINQQDQMVSETCQGSLQNNQISERQPSASLRQALVCKIQGLEDLNVGLRNQLERLQTKFSQLEERMQIMEKVEEKKLTNITQILQQNQNIVNIFL
eukprot:TRINITY_DN7000_c4_g1_i1.p1 TRINITY_DN7000_c4_g1~~TRINITY_DN7000_c4_g1_i1.p1  ORF type:complete len:289 (-),score=24.47 TRINITY_DN7000_c4_g1_i1:211-1008(-)